MWPPAHIISGLRPESVAYAANGVANCGGWFFEIVAQALRELIAAVGAKTAYIEPGSPLEN
jgi:hypothetical protein